MLHLPVLRKLNQILPTLSREGSDRVRVEGQGVSLTGLESGADLGGSSSH